MVAYLRSRSQKLPIALIAGVLIAVSVAAAALAMPISALGQITDTLALAGVLPDGIVTRVALALVGGTALGAIGWAIVVLTVGTHVLLHTGGTGMPVLRPGDAHPDAPARRPIHAAEELGPPLELDAPDDAGETALPADFEQPLAAFDPAAIPAAPREPVRPVAPLARPERLETFELTPLVRNSGDAAPSLSSLLDRLERGTGQHPRHPSRAIGEALGALRDRPAY